MLKFDVKTIIMTSLFQIIALIILEIIWNLAGYQAESLMWAAKVAIFAWVGFASVQAIKNKV
jgi:hypothetical protein